jgi:hypothetical protein
VIAFARISFHINLEKEQKCAMACGLVALSFGFLFVASAALGQANGKTANPFAGTWKVNFAQSKVPEGTPPLKEESMIVAVEGDTSTVTILDTQTDGKVTTQKISTPTAGGPITSIDPPATDGGTGVSKKIDDHTYLLTYTMNGKVVLEQRSVLSPDNKTLAQIDGDRAVSSNKSEIPKVDLKVLFRECARASWTRSAQMQTSA